MTIPLRVLHHHGPGNGNGLSAHAFFSDANARTHTDHVAIFFG